MSTIEVSSGDIVLNTDQQVRLIRAISNLPYSGGLPGEVIDRRRLDACNRLDPDGAARRLEALSETLSRVAAEHEVERAELNGYRRDVDALRRLLGTA